VRRGAAAASGGRRRRPRASGMGCCRGSLADGRPGRGASRDSAGAMLDGRGGRRVGADVFVAETGAMHQEGGGDGYL
jgi:hypothetical protein